MKNPNYPNSPLGRAPRGVQGIDVDRTADALLRAGERPTVQKIRAKLGTGSPNTINPLLDQWWHRLSNRLESGPKALNRLPEAVVHAAESLWHACLDQARLSTRAEFRALESTLDTKKSDQDLRAEILKVREQELIARLSDQDRTLSILETETKAFAALYKKEHAKTAAETRRIVALQSEIESLQKLLASLSTRATSKLHTVKSSLARNSSKTVGAAKIKPTRKQSLLVKPRRNPTRSTRKHARG